jgi:hypothetical protein
MSENNSDNLIFGIDKKKFLKIFFFSISLILIIILSFSNIESFINRFLFANDFFIYLLGSKLFWLKENLYDMTLVNNLKNQFDLNILTGQGYVYPPLLAFLLYPLAELSLINASYIWAIINITTYYSLGFVLFSRINLKRNVLFLVLFLYCFFPPFLGSFGTGQINIIVFAFYVLYLLNLNKKNCLSGIFLSVAGVLKIYPVFFVINQFMRKNLKIVFGFILGTILLIGVPLVFNPFQNLVYFITKTLPGIQSNAEVFWLNQSFNGFISRMLYDSHNSIALFHISVQAEKLISQSVSIIGIIGLIYLTHYFKQKKERFYLLELVWLAGIILIAGKSNFWIYVPTSLIFLFLVMNWKILLTWQKNLTIISYLLYVYQIFLGGFLTGKSFGTILEFGKFGFLISGGFFGLIILFVILVSLLINKKLVKFDNLFTIN